MSDFQVNKAHEVKANEGEYKTLRFFVASMNIEIKCVYGNQFFAFKNYLATFDKPDIEICITQADIDFERRNHPETLDPDIIVDCEKVAVTYDYGYLEPFVVLQKLADAIPPFQAFLMHGSVVALDGQAYMFTAQSGVGKTTRTRLWMQEYPSSIIVNGDKPIIRITDQGVLACGTPWAGKEGWNTNTMVPLRAIFLLERAEEDSVEEISIGQAFPILLQQIHRPTDPAAMRMTLRLLQALQGKVKFYRFRSTRTPEAVRLAYETAKP